MRTSVISTIAALAVATAAACGGSGSPTTPTNTSATPSAQPSPVEPVTPAGGQPVTPATTGQPSAVPDPGQQPPPVQPPPVVPPEPGPPGDQAQGGRSDLKLSGTIRFADASTDTIAVLIDVVNDGDKAASGASGRARVGNSTWDAALYQSDGGTATVPHTVNPGERGYVRVVVPLHSVARCRVLDVEIDVDHTFQSGTPDPFANDGARIETPCLTWTTPITADSLGMVPGDPVLVGKTLGNIVGGVEIGRNDGQSCTACHYQTSGNKYSPPLPQLGKKLFSPFQSIGGRSWADPGPHGLANSFLSTLQGALNKQKPLYLRQVVQQWLADGALPGSAPPPVPEQPPVVTPPPPPVTNPQPPPVTNPTPDGNQLYTTYCAGCHGAAPGAKKGRTAAQIQAAIDAGNNGMNTPALTSLTSDQLQAIATAIQ